MHIHIRVFHPCLGTNVEERDAARRGGEIVK